MTPMVGLLVGNQSASKYQNPENQSESSLEVFLLRSFTPLHEKPSLERDETCPLLDRQLLSLLIQDCFLVDYGNLEGTNSKNYSEKFI